MSPHTGRHVLLTELERGVLEFERTPWRYVGPKEARIRETLGVEPTRYYQVLNVLLDDERAFAYDPILVHNLRERRTVRRHH